MNILVTGGAGYVGSVLTEQLLLLGHRVFVFDTLDYGVHSLLPLLEDKRLRVQCGNVLDVELLQSCVKSFCPDVIIHLAAIVGFPACDRNPKYAREVIVDGTRYIAQICKDKNIGLIHASTGSVYGKVEVLCDETTDCNPQSTYGQFKWEAENFVREVGGVNLRFATLCGLSPCMRFDLLPNDFVWKACKHKYIVLYEGHSRRTFLSVYDAALAYISILNNYPQMQGETYNVGSENLNITKLQLAYAIRDIIPYELITNELASDPDKRDYEVSYKKFYDVTKFKARNSLPSIIENVYSLCKLMRISSEWRFST